MATKRTTHRSPGSRIIEGLEQAVSHARSQRKGAVRTRSQIKNPITGTWTKRDDKSGKFMDVKADAEPFKGVRREKDDVKRRAKAESSPLVEQYLRIRPRLTGRNPEVTAFMKTYRAFVTSYFGKRCKTVEHGCGCCQMWKAYDLVDTMIV